jgi:putative ABC transport system permease protein
MCDGLTVVFGAMFTTFALIALILSAVGLYAVTAYSVTQRTQEIGVRMALGAQPGSIRWLILRRALIQLSIGLTVGIGGAFAVGRLLRSMLVQIPTADPVTLTTIVAILVVIAITACLAPSRRATRLDPSTALRYE